MKKQSFSVSGAKLLHQNKAVEILLYATKRWALLKITANQVFF